MPDDDCENNHDHAHGFAIPLPASLVEAMTGGGDRQRLHAQVAEAEVTHFLDGLNVDQCLALRRILCQDNESATNNYFDGQLVTLLRVVHKVDVNTGEPFDVSELDTAPPVADR